MERQSGPGDRSLGGDRSGGRSGAGPAGHEGRRLRQERRQDRGGGNLDLDAAKRAELGPALGSVQAENPKLANSRLSLAAQVQPGAAARACTSVPNAAFTLVFLCGVDSRLFIYLFIFFGASIFTRRLAPAVVNE